MESHRYQALLENPGTFTTAATQLSYAEIVKDEVRRLSTKSTCG